MQRKKIKSNEPMPVWMKGAATKAADTGRYKHPLLDTCRSCKQNKILVINGVCLACWEKAKKQAK